MLTNLRARAAASDAAHRKEHLALQSTRDELRNEVRKLEVLHDNPVLQTRQAALTSEMNALKDAEFADYLTRNPKIADKLIASEILRADKKVAAIESEVFNAALKAEMVLTDGGVRDRRTILTGRLQAATAVLKKKGLNPITYMSPTIAADSQELGGNPLAQTQVLPQLPAPPVAHTPAAPPVTHTPAAPQAAAPPPPPRAPTEAEMAAAVAAADAVLAEAAARAAAAEREAEAEAPVPAASPTPGRKRRRGRKQTPGKAGMTPYSAFASPAPDVPVTGTPWGSSAKATKPKGAAARLANAEKAAEMAAAAAAAIEAAAAPAPAPAPGGRHTRGTNPTGSPLAPPLTFSRRGGHGGHGGRGGRTS